MKLNFPGFSLEDPNSQIPTGVSTDYFGTDAPEGWILLDGGTIGTPASGATNRANMDTKNLYVLLWNAMSDGEAPVTPGGHGSDPEADFNANKAIAVPDLRGRITAGRDNMGGVSAGRLTLAVPGTVLGGSGGEQGTQLLSSHIPSGIFSDVQIVTTAPAGGGGASIQGSPDTANSSVSNAAQSSGAGGEHNNIQPTLIVNKIIKL